MANRFSVIALTTTVLLGILIYVLHLFQLVTPANEVYARSCALGLFIVSFLFLGWWQAKYYRLSWKHFYKNDTLIIICLSVLLASLFLCSRIGYYAVGFFAGAVLLHFFYRRKFYPLPKFFYFVFLYALLLFLGTIGTEKGFRFPNSTLSFYVLPLSLCFFRLSKTTLLRIAELFFKIAIVFLATCILYWWYNFLQLDANFITWIAEKTGYSVEMTAWEEQAKIHNSNYYSAYFFVTSWSYYYHPSFVSLILFFGLITGFYLYHKKNTNPTITKLELILYIVLCLFVIILMESRVGLVGFLFINAVTGLYYLKLKTKHFKIGLILYLLLGCASLYVLNDSVSDFVDDDARDAYRRIAISYVHDNFWWGSGFHQQRIALEQQAEMMENVLPDIIFPHTGNPIYYVHNQFLGNMVQFGIWGLLLLSAMLIAIAYYAVKKRSYLLQVMLSVVFLFMMIEEPLYVLKSIVCFLTFLMFFTAISESGKLTVSDTTEMISERK